jgi:hypothetical protein
VALSCAVTGQALDSFLEAAPPAAAAVSLDADFTTAFEQCLHSVVWVGSQLQHLQLPGKPHTTAAALAALQAQQQQLQQQLEAAVQQFQGAVTSCEASGQQQVGAGDSSGSSCAVSVELELSNSVDHGNAAGADAASASAADGGVAPTLPGAKLQPAGGVPPALVAVLVELGLPQQLQAFGYALWPLLPQPHCCSNWGCGNMAAVSEVRLAAKASRCSSCKVARWVRLGRGCLSKVLLGLHSE